LENVTIVYLRFDNYKERHENICCGIEFIIEIEAESYAEAEQLGWDWTPRYPDYLNGDFVQADRVHVLHDEE